MASTFLGVEIGKRTLISHQKALSVIGHNVANANNENYSKQKVIFQTLDPLYRAQLNRAERAGQIGQGVEVASIRRERDIYLDQRIYTENGKQTFWEVKEGHLVDLENVYNAIGEINFQEKLDSFWQGWQNLIINPNNSASREELLQESLILTRDIRDKNQKLNDLRREINEKLIGEIDEINQIAQNLARLNQEIQSSKNLGDNPNDLLDKRDALISRLSHYAELKVNHRDNDELMVYLGGRILVQGDKVNQFRYYTDPQNEGYIAIEWQPSSDRINTKLGSLRAHLNLRDVEIPEQINSLDTITTNLVYGVNGIHRQGFNHYGTVTGDFFKLHHPGGVDNGNYDSNFDGVLDKTLLFEIKGNKKLDPKGIVGQNGTLTFRNNQDESLVSIEYFANEKIEDIVKKVNLNQDSINFFLTAEGQLLVKSRSNSQDYPFAIEFLNDTGNLLNTVAGVLEAPDVPFDSNFVNGVDALNDGANFSRVPLKNISAWINVNQVIVGDSGYIATREGDNYDITIEEEVPRGSISAGIAQEIADLRFENIFLDNKKTFDDYYVNLVGGIGSELKTARLEKEKYAEILHNYNDLRQSISGVNIDEELANMVVFQHGYEAGARVIRLMDELLEVIVSLK